MATLSSGSTLIWYLAEFEAIAGNFPETTAWHFVIACFKLRDLDVEEFLRHAPEEAQNKREEIVGDARGLKEQVSRKCGAVTTARRRLREALHTRGVPRRAQSLRQPRLLEAVPKTTTATRFNQNPT